MKKDANGRPLCGAASKMLGARVPVDVAPDSQGDVHPGTKGMSVAPDRPEFLPIHLRPAKLGGTGKVAVFEIASDQLSAALLFRRDPRAKERHGFVEPAEVMKLNVYQAALAATSPAWKEFP
jgi:hypothetical protein